MKHLLSITILLTTLLITTTTLAEMQILNLGVRVIESDEDYVEFSWKVDIQSTVKSQCYLVISFRDNDGFEIHMENAIIDVLDGSNHFTGQGSCKTKIWNQVKDYHASIKCH